MDAYISATHTIRSGILRSKHATAAARRPNISSLDGDLRAEITRESIMQYKVSLGDLLVSMNTADAMDMKILRSFGV
ncbi:hypothetical protein DPMN_084122 [Dreissena polymorpha]|uniref:Uncharacterized protein n=1 Tax=Dreissena polymorpha TaxID=45954 RepID=A0A9D3YCJ9_DREPO|nr:hypothetical protein DPMN_084122 [Dreissena polymorpha]